MIPSSGSIEEGDANVIHQMSPNKEDDSYSCDDEPFCTAHRRFPNPSHFSSCNASFVCTDLPGNPTADYGISVRVGDAAPVEIVREGQVVRGTVGPRSSSLVSVWYTEGSSRDWKCHYWCHSEEESPDAECGRAAERESPSSEVDITHFPWQVQILRRSRGGYEFVCSGALVVI